MEWIAETVGNSYAELSRQVVWAAGIERVYLRVPKFRWGELGSKKGQTFHGLSRFATADGRPLTWADHPSPIGTSKTGGTSKTMTEPIGNIHGRSGWTGNG